MGEAKRTWQAHITAGRSAIAALTVLSLMSPAWATREETRVEVGFKGRFQKNDDRGEALEETTSDADAAESAMLAACGLQRTPTGSDNPFTRNHTDLKAEWRWDQDTGRVGGNLHYQFTQDYVLGNRRKPYKNAVCETFILAKLDAQSPSRTRQRCQVIRDSFSISQQDLAMAGSDNASSLTASFLGDVGRGNSDSGSANDICDRDEPSAAFACAYRDIVSKFDDPALEKKHVKAIISLCARRQVDLSSAITTNDQRRSLANSGVDLYGNGYCGPRGGTRELQEQHPWYDTVGNVVLGMTKVIAPAIVLNEANRRHENAVMQACKYNYSLGMGCAVSAGAIGGSCGGGFGCAGGIYGGQGGVVYNGAGYSGYGGGCAIGSCYGNGGMVVGGSGVPYMGGIMGGGTCGVPPYSMTYVGCGNGGYGAGGGIYGGNGLYNGGVGAPGGWGGNAGFPGPYGTLNGNNGWGGPYGAQGMYGQPGLYGSNQFNYAQVQAQMQFYQAYLSQMNRQLQAANAAAKNYQAALDEGKRVEEREYQAYMAYQLAQMGVSSPTSGYSSGYQTPVAYRSSVPVGQYYPPYMSQTPVYNGTGSSFSLGVSGSFGRTSY